MARVRVDLLLVARGLAQTRAQAQAAIAAGGVTADGAPVSRAAQLVDEHADLRAAAAHPWVSRAGLKLAHALDEFGVDPSGRECLDIGASTGGFTEVLLSRGAARVTAVDVGRGQLHPRLRADPRVISREGLDARRLAAADLAAPPTLIVCDASFIGLEKVLPAALALAAPGADLIALVKPQYEAGPGRRVRDEAAALPIAEAVAHRLDGLAGFAVRRLADSPIRGGEGQPEYLLWAVRA
jgi:23S rRNA (cytidine1920-2'-O)/16S rRNA (cytidine1409-2'-O)-methyltransferase